MILWPIAAKRGVTSITVLERYRSVVRLVRPYIPARVQVVNVDVFRYRPRRKYDVIFHDIWPTISVANLLDMLRLEDKYASHLARGGWQGSWQRSVCEAMAKQRLAEDSYAALMGRCGAGVQVPAKLAKQLGCHP